MASKVARLTDSAQNAADSSRCYEFSRSAEPSELLTSRTASANTDFCQTARLIVGAIRHLILFDAPRMTAGAVIFAWRGPKAASIAALRPVTLAQKIGDGKRHLPTVTLAFRNQIPGPQRFFFDGFGEKHP